VLAALALLVGCGDVATLPVAAGTGPQPTLPAPKPTLIPTVNIAPATGWVDGAALQPAPGTRVEVYAAGLDHPRWLHVLTNGDVLVAETNAPPKADGGQGLTGWVKGLVMGLVMKRAGAATPSADRISLLRDADGDGVAEQRHVMLEGRRSPFGMALVGPWLYVADSDAVWRFPYVEGNTRIVEPGVKLLDLPAGPINHHWTKNLIASPDGKTLYVTVGSNSNVGERGMEAESGRAAIWALDLASGAQRVYASGLRNPNGMAFASVPSPSPGAAASAPVLWTVVNERDEIGSDLVPDYLSSVRDGAFYGWPYSYYGANVDERVQPPRPDLVNRAVVPDYALGPHTASLGLASATGNTLPARFADGMFIGQHGSWNRRPHSGYKVIFVPFAQGRPTGAPPLDVLTGFLGDDGQARGRPVGVALDARGALLVADDVGNRVWRVSTPR